MKQPFRFETGTVRIEGHPRKAQTIRCSKCGRRDSVVDSTSSTMASSVIANKFRAKGWHVASRASGDLCPSHAPHSLSPKQKRAAYCRIAGVPRKEEKTMSQPQPAVPEPPREATVDERRRILDALEEHYDVQAKRYTGSFTDDAVSSKLKLPRAWVSDLRDKLFGPEANEAKALRDAALEELAKRASDLEDEALGLASKAETLGKDIRKVLGK